MIRYRRGVTMKIKDGVIGFAIGDAMGVPTEFHKREDLLRNPVTSMIAKRFEGLPKGSWSDDTSMIIATMDAIIHHGVDYEKIANNFVRWANNNEFCSYKRMFGIGTTTRQALYKYYQKLAPATECGGKSFQDNGNGSLMRILPIAYYAYSNKLEDSTIQDIVESVSSITHGHEISILGCYLYVKYVMLLLGGMDKIDSYHALQQIDLSHYKEESIKLYHRILKGDITSLVLDEIHSSGYVVDTLEASFWCFLMADNFRDCVVAGTNIGGDTDTIAGIAGGLAGIYYGLESIPEDWMKDLVKREYLEDISEEYARYLESMGK